VRKSLSLYKRLRSAGVSRHGAIWSGFVPTRIQVAGHVLRGRPALYGIDLGRDTFTVRQPHTFVAECRWNGTPE